MEKTAGERPSKRKAEEEKQPSDQLRFNEIRELMLTGPDAEEEIELKRREAYIERPTQKLLRNLLEGGKKAEILPSYDLSLGFRYKTVESVFDDRSIDVPPGKAEEFLKHLNHLEILKKSFFDTVSACPVCGSTSITLHYRCSKCSSRHIVKAGLTEHVPCGNIDERDKYIQEHLMPTCPKCGVRLVEGEYRDMGLWYVCRECGERFEHPHLDMTCRKCDKQFTIETAIVREISKYALNPSREQEIRQNVTSLESIYKLLTALDFSVEMPASVMGEKSGIQHKFSLLARKKFGDRESIIAIDHAVGDVEVGSPPLILYIYKISEVKVDLPIFVAIPKLSETAKRIAQGYDLLVIEGIPKEKERLAVLNDEIQKRLDERIRMQAAEIAHQWIFRKGKRVDVWRDVTGRFVGKKRKNAYGSKIDLEKLPLLERTAEPKPKRPTLIERIKKAIKKETDNDRNE